MQVGPLIQSFDDAWRRLRPRELGGDASGRRRTSLYEIIHYDRSPLDIETSNHPPTISNTASETLQGFLHIQPPTHHTTHIHNGLVRRFFFAARASCSRTLQGWRFHSARPQRSRSMLGRPRQLLQVPGSPQHYRQRTGRQEGKRSVRAGAQRI